MFDGTLIVALLSFPNANAIVSLTSSSVSLTMLTPQTWLATPGVKVNVPVMAV